VPNYPVYPMQPSSGELPSMFSSVNRASDLRYTGSTAPHYRAMADRAHGRHLAGIGEVQDEKVNQGWAVNELAVMAEMDDVQGNGIFDPPGTGPNLYPDAGIMAQRASIPGYWARERMFAPSEVVDITTGRPIIPVNAGAVSMDSAAQVAFIEKGMFTPPQPVVGASSARQTPLVSTVNVRQSPEAIHGLGQEAEGLSRWQWLGIVGLVSLAAGGAYASFRKGKRRKK
jgi:hypothetical protein